MIDAPAPFVVGAGRSGTTLLRLMLDAHPLFAIPAETHFLPLCAALHERLEGASASDAERRSELLALLTNFPTWPDFTISPDDLREAFDRVRPFTIADGIRSFFLLYAHRRNKARWGDKTPTYTASMDRIAGLLPEARFIHIIRDGRDVAVSLRPLWFAPSKHIGELGAFWRDRVREGRRIGESLYHYLEVRYESLIADSGEELRRICNFLDVPYAEEMTRYWERASSRLGEVADRWQGEELVITREQRLFNHRYTNVPPERSRSGRWREVLTSEELSEFNREAGELLAELGYD